MFRTDLPPDAALSILFSEAGYLDLYGKGGKLRRIYIPKHLKAETDKWLAESGRTSGYLFC